MTITITFLTENDFHLEGNIQTKNLQTHSDLQVLTPDQLDEIRAELKFVLMKLESYVKSRKHELAG